MGIVREGDIISGQMLTNHDAMYEWWRRFMARTSGSPGKPDPINFPVVMGANYTGALINVGDVCEFDGYPFEEIDTNNRQPDPRNDRWLKAVTPDANRVGWGIALQPMSDADGDDREGAEFFVVGTGYAKVVINNEDHKYAERRNGFRTLFSCASGLVKILHKPAGETLLETRFCHVELVAPGDIVDIIEVNDTGASGGHIIYASSTNSYAFPGNVRKWNSSSKSFDNSGSCWLLLTNEWGDVAGNVPAVNWQYYGPAKYLGAQNLGDVVLPTYVCSRSELPTEIVEVDHPDVDTGKIVAVNASGLHPGRIRRKNGSTFDAGQDIWIRFVNGFIVGSVAGAVRAVQNEFYGPARYAERFDLVENEGEEDETHDKRSVFVCECSEAIFLCKFDSSVSEGSTGTVSLWHSSSLTDSGENITGVLAWGSNWESGKKGVVQRIAGRWAASQMEWAC